jgi:hypothetical protein
MAHHDLVMLVGLERMRGSYYLLQSMSPDGLLT